MIYALCLALGFFVGAFAGVALLIAFGNRIIRLALLKEQADLALKIETTKQAISAEKLRQTVRGPKL